MASAGRIQTLLTCARAQERHAMLQDGFSVGYIRLGTRLILYMTHIYFYVYGFTWDDPVNEEIPNGT